MELKIRYSDGSSDGAADSGDAHPRQQQPREISVAAAALPRLIPSVAGASGASAVVAGGTTTVLSTGGQHKHLQQQKQQSGGGGAQGMEVGDGGQHQVQAVIIQVYLSFVAL